MTPELLELDDTLLDAITGGKKDGGTVDVEREEDAERKTNPFCTNRTNCGPAG